MTWEIPECNTLDESAAMLHELYASLVGQGFTEHTALHIVSGDGCCKRKEDDDDEG